jgi:hypothetical protein
MIEDGANGTNGAVGSDGSDGANGDSLEFDWNGTELGVRIGSTGEYTYVDLKGEKGTTGDRGLQGIQGIQGIQGVTGNTGPAGATGQTGQPGTDSISQQSVRIVLPSSGTIQGRCDLMDAGVEYPTGWLLKAGDNAADLEIDHLLERRLAFVSVFEVSAGVESMLLGNTAYSGVQNQSNAIAIINGFATVEKQLILYLIFL